MINPFAAGLQAYPMMGGGYGGGYPGMPYIAY